MSIRSSSSVLMFAVSVAVSVAEPPMRPDHRYLPGETPSPLLRYQNAAPTSVVVAGTWDSWTGRWPMRVEGDLWVLDVRELPASFGYQEFKFVVDGNWEDGANRAFCINEHGLIEKPSSDIFSATIDDHNEINVVLRRTLPQAAQLKVRLTPDAAVKSVRIPGPSESGALQGHFISGGNITFIFDEKTQGVTLSPSDRVAVAGNFTGWDANGWGDGRWRLHRREEGRWEMTTQLPALRPPSGEKELLFKFVINGNRWLQPPNGAPNAAADGKGNVNLRIDPARGSGSGLKIVTETPLDLSVNYMLVIEGAGEKRLWSPITTGKVLDLFASKKPLGITLDRANECTTYRLFAPRASSVRLCLYDTPEFEVHKPEYRRIEPVERYAMWQDREDGVWEISLLGLDVGRYYSFNVDGPGGIGEAFNKHAQVADPYAFAMAHAHNNSIVMDPEETNRWFAGWTDQDFRLPKHEDIVIYEMHVRDMTKHPSSHVGKSIAGKYEGLIASEGSGAALDHLKSLGVNVIELMPVQEFANGEDRYDWGYGPGFYFAPEASYGRQPLKGSQFYEFKNLVNELHNRGFGVIVDVVYNHVGGVNVFNLIDRRYHFRFNPDFSPSNFSGCGNDVRTEAPMMRRLIVDSVVHWMKEFHVDGFRFDLAELIDMETMMAIRDAARAVNPDVLLISEPWSFRGENKRELTGTGWSAWNNDFRYAAKDFVQGKRNRDWLQKCITGSVEIWAANPLQPINYVESHDDMALADELCTRPDRDGRHLQENDVAANRLAATVLFTSLGIPMMNAGQEFVRSKRGISNTYDRGDAINAIDWNDRNRPLAAETLNYYTDLLRLRLSSEGAAFRASERPPHGYYRWILPQDQQSLGYIVNVPRVHGGAGFIVLLNAGGDASEFNVPFLAGRWRLIGNGRLIQIEGLADEPDVEGPKERVVRVPPMSSYIFINE